MIPFITCAMCTLFGYLLCYLSQVRPLREVARDEHIKYRRAKVKCMALTYKVRRLQSELYGETEPTDPKQADQVLTSLESPP